MSSRSSIVLTCEHAGNRVPLRYRDLFAGALDVLESHRGYDPGAYELARGIGHRLHIPVIACLNTRLLVEPNRSRSHPRLFSEFSRLLPELERSRVIRLYYDRHRNAVVDAVEEHILNGQHVVHIGVHTFVPILKGMVREAEVGLLYDPARDRELAYCRMWQSNLQSAFPDWRVRRNYPYRGSSDGLTTALRERWGGDRYLGIELEVRQDLVSTTGMARNVGRAIAVTLPS